jgi:hypothetical protein
VTQEGHDPDAAARIRIAMFHGLILEQAWDNRTDVESFATAAQAMTEAYFSAGSSHRRR